jgi:hypothetical protein
MGGSSGVSDVTAISRRIQQQTMPRNGIRIGEAPTSVVGRVQIVLKE